MQALPIAVLAIPFLGAILCLAARDRFSKPIAVIAGLLTAIGSIILASDMRTGLFITGAMPWLGKAGLKGFFGYWLDPLANIMLLASSVVGIAIIAYSISYLSPDNREHPSKEGHARYFFWLMLFIGSMIGLALSPTLLQMIIFWEMTTLCSWALISYYNDPDSLKAGMKALMMTSFGGLFFLGGLAWIFSATGSMGFDALGKMSPAARSLAFAFFLIAAWAKSAQIPFTNWLPEAMAAPTPISAYLHAAAMVKAGIFLVARLLLAGWQLPTGTALLVSIAALVTMFGALFLYFFQDDLKRLLAYSTIAQLGYIFLGLGLGALGASMAMRGAVLHILMHAFAKTTLFLSVGAIAYATGTRKMSKLSGLGRTLPVAAVAFFVGAFALTGVPPLACFWSKLYMIAGTLEVSGSLGPIVLILVLIESLVSFGWFLWVGQKVFFGKTERQIKDTGLAEHEAAQEPHGEGSAKLNLSAGITLVLWIMIILVLVAPIAGIPIVSRLITGP